jgi:hypothetical protein
MATDVLDRLKDAIELKEAAPMIRRSEPTLYRLAVTGKIEHIRVSGRLYFTRQSRIDFVEGSRPKTRKPPTRRSEAQRRADALKASEESMVLGCRERHNGDYVNLPTTVH